MNRVYLPLLSRKSLLLAQRLTRSPSLSGARSGGRQSPGTVRKIKDIIPNGQWFPRPASPAPAGAGRSLTGVPLERSRDLAARSLTK